MKIFIMHLDSNRRENGQDNSYAKIFVQQEYLQFFNNIIDEIKTLAFVNNQIILSHIQADLSNSIKAYAENMLKPYYDTEKNDMEEIFEVSFIDDISFAFFNTVAKEARNRILSCNNLSELSEMEDNLISFCNMKELGDPADYVDEDQGGLEDKYLTLEVFGEIGEQENVYLNLFNDIMECVNKYIGNLFTNEAKTKCYVNNDDNKAFFDRYFNRSRIRNKHLRSDTVAIISNDTNGDDILLTVKGILRMVKGISICKMSPYDNVKWARNGKEALCLGSDIVNTNLPYKNKEVKMDKLLQLIEDISKAIGNQIEYETHDSLLPLIKDLEKK